MISLVNNDVLDLKREQFIIIDLTKGVKNELHATET